MDRVNITNEVSGDGTFFAHLLLNYAAREDLEEIAKTLTDTNRNVEVDLKINGKQVFVKDFNQILLTWFKEIEERQKAKFDKLATDAGLIEKANEIVRTRLNKVNQALIQMENTIDSELGWW